MNHPIIMHCNYAEQGQTLDAMCALAVRHGFDGVEFRRRRPGIDESVRDYLDAVEAAVTKHGLEYVLFGSPGADAMLPDAAARRREVDAAAAFFTEAARRFRLTVCNTFTGTLATEGVDYMAFDRHGSAIATEAQWAAAVESLQTLGDLAASLNFRLALETHNVYLHDLPAPTRRLVDAVDRASVGVNLDFGNILLHPAGGTLADSFNLLADKVYMLHLKNMYLIPQRRHHQWIAARLSDGVINHRELLRLALAAEFAGPIVIEAPQPGDREHFAAADVRYLRDVLAEVAECRASNL